MVNSKLQHQANWVELAPAPLDLQFDKVAPRKL